MTERRKYGLFVRTKASYDEALEATKAALKEQGFGVLTEIDVRATLKQKLDVSFRPYKILGACNPPIAHQALSTNLGAGLMMPCNVVVYEDSADRTTVLAIDPMGTFAAEEPALRPIAEQVQAKLMRVIETL